MFNMLCALVITCSALSEELNFDSLISDLGHEQFEVRENATKKLKELCPGSYANVLLTLSRSEELAIEVRYRLSHIAESVFKNKTVKTYEQYLKSFGYLGIYVENCRLHNGNVLKIKHIDGDSPCENILQFEDFLLGVNGISFTNSNISDFYNLFGSFWTRSSLKPGQLLELEVMRILIDEDGTYQEKIFNVKIRSIWKPEWKKAIDKLYDDKIINNLWEKFCENKHNV